MTYSQEALTSVTANGEKLVGGDRKVDFDLDFKMKIRGQKEENQKQPDAFTLMGTSHNPDIEDDLILGYPWLQENSLALLKTEEALGCGWGNEILPTWLEKKDLKEEEQPEE